MTDRPAPPVSTCDSCGDAFYAQADAWGATCGTCIAARIELLLLRVALGQDAGRKPMRRSAAAETVVPARRSA